MRHVANSPPLSFFFFGQNSRLKLLRKLALIIFMVRNEWAVLEILITKYVYFIYKFRNMKLICIQCSWTCFLKGIVRSVFTILSRSNDEVLLQKKVTAILVAYTCTKRLIRKRAITCSKLAIETLEQGVKYVQS